MDAEAKEQMREENHKALIHTADAGGWKGGFRSSDVKGVCVEFTKFAFTEKLFSCAEIFWRALTVGTVGSCCSN